MLSLDTSAVFSRFTQLALLRLLTNKAVMGELTHTLGEAWAVYDRWLDDPRIQFHSEPDGMDSMFRDATLPFHTRTAPNWVSDCYILAFPRQSNAVLVTFDKALLRLARESGCSTLTPV
jgi:predicted nucleic acid-binding protein